MSVLLDMFAEDINDTMGETDCSICGNTLDDTQITIKCNHSFCYECLLNSYQGKSCQFNASNKVVRQCPYCRTPADYLPLKPDQKPIKGIHKEYTYYKASKVAKNKTMCHAILKSGTRAGQPCNCKCLPNKQVCGRHKTWTPT